jgi:hypothetical protein
MNHLPDYLNQAPDPHPVDEKAKRARGLWMLTDPTLPTWFVPNSPNGREEVILFEFRKAHRQRKNKRYVLKVDPKKLESELPQERDVVEAYNALAERYGSGTKWRILVGGCEVRADEKAIDYTFFRRKGSGFSREGMHIRARLISRERPHQLQTIDRVLAREIPRHQEY